MKKYNKNLKNIPLGFPNGGMPIQLDDFLQLETNTYLSGITSILRGFSCILQGCLISNINTTNNTCDMSDGLVMINDIIYDISAVTGQSYPFSIIPGNTVPDTRGFRDGNYKDVAVDYNYSIKTSFTYLDVVDIYPVLTTNEIYFDPFTAQKASYILNNLAKQKGECIIKNISTTTINKDEKGGSLIGTVNWLPSSNVPKYAYFGYNILSNLGKLALNTNVGTTAGSDDISLIESNLPQHHHTATGLSTTANGGHNHVFSNAFFSEHSTYNGGGQYVSYKYPYSQYNSYLGNNIGSGSTDFDNIPYAFDDLTIAAGTHVHTVAGQTGTTTYLDTAGNTQTTFNVKGQTYGIKLLEWTGFPSVYTINNTLSLNGKQVVSYKFWNLDIPYINM